MGLTEKYMPLDRMIKPKIPDIRLSRLESPSDLTKVHRKLNKSGTRQFGGNSERSLITSGQSSNGQ